MMATSADATGVGPSPRRCPNAGEYVRRRLDQADGPLSPAELAEEYGCTQTHMRTVMSELAGESEIRRVSRGLYVAEPDESSGDAEPADMGLPELVGSDGENVDEETESTEEDADADQPDDMATPDEYERQHTDRDGGDAGAGGREETELSEEDAGADGREETESSEGDADTNERDDTAAAAGVVGGIDPRTVMVIVSAAAVVYVIHRSVSSGDDQDDEQDAADATDDIQTIEDAIAADPNGGPQA